MKKLLLSLLTVLVILTSCEKEDDLFTPVNPPNTNTNMNNTDTTTVNNTDTTTVGNTDTIINNNGEVTVLTPSQTLPFEFTTVLGEGYDVTRAEFEINCSEQTNILADTSYSYISTNHVSSVPAQRKYGNGQISLYSSPMSPLFYGQGAKGIFATTTYPVNSNYWPSHMLDFEEELMLCYIMEYNYTPGILSLDLLTYACGGVIVEWSVEMVVTEYSDGIIELSINNGPNTTMDGQINWDSDLKLTLHKNF